MTSLRPLLAALAIAFLATPLPSQTIGIAPNIATRQTSVGTSATLVCPARPGRRRAIVTEVNAVDFHYGGPAVSRLSGTFIKGAAGATVTLNTPLAIYAAAMAAVTITCAELY